jgi:hypothetical protein
MVEMEPWEGMGQTPEYKDVKVTALTPAKAGKRAKEILKASYVRDGLLYRRFNIHEIVESTRKRTRKAK